ncbi:hypothetical protein K1X12_16645 [Hyphomonas sp. WL0036]|uniref:hypothetical protein n=1 Tax=Hyphomonas sediminis TaxID=2866160 RepID=UPI001C8272A3|nr:hypothetical protein [Hyphomonas sediminis]MBY9068525.1 hypothetical protein [Hyphomonas sediminis]
MMRIISILLVLAGLLAAGIGGAALMEEQFPKSSAPAAVPTSAESVTEEDLAAPAPKAEPAAEPAAGPAAGPASAEADPTSVAGSEAAPAPVEEMPAPTPEPAPEPAPEATAQAESLSRAAPMSNDELSFQPMMEEAPTPAPTMRSAPAADTADMAAAEAPAAATAPPEAVDIDDPNVTAAVSESFIDSLKTVPVAHETPASAEYKRPFNVTFAIDATGDTTAVDALPGRGVIEEGTARVSDRVEVRLSGASFRIEPTSPPIQSLSPLTENTWRWSVTPLTAGDQDLTFEIFAVDADEVVPLRTYRDTVTVRVSGLNRAIAFADQANPLFVLLGGLGSILAGILGVARFVFKK